MRACSVPLFCITALAIAACGQGGKAPEKADAEAGAADILERSPDSDWQALDPENTLYLDFAAGRVVIALAPAYAPRIVANIKALARENYYDGAAFVRAQDNYVVQWGRTEESPREVRAAEVKLAPEFSRAIAANVPFVALANADAYAPEVGFSDAFPAARNTSEGQTWLAHCYGMVGVGRDDNVDTGAGQELYAVIGHAPRHLDRNVTLVGRVVRGMELLSTLRRGTGPLGFYETAAERTPIASIRVAADVAEAERVQLEALRTDSGTFTALVDSRRNRREAWFKYAAGRIDLCNVPLPVREAD